MCLVVLSLVSWLHPGNLEGLLLFFFYPPPPQSQHTNAGLWKMIFPNQTWFLVCGCKRYHESIDVVFTEPHRQEVRCFSLRRLLKERHWKSRPAVPHLWTLRRVHTKSTEPTVPSRFFVSLATLHFLLGSGPESVPGPFCCATLCRALSFMGWIVSPVCSCMNGYRRHRKCLSELHIQSNV